VQVEARRVVPDSAASVLQKLDRWMDREECLQPKRRLQDRITWEARRDFLGSVKRSFNVGGRGYALASAHEVGASTSAVDDASTLVVLTADFHASRRRAIAGSVATFGTFGAGAAALVLLAAGAGGSLIIAGGAAALLLGVGGGSTALIARANRELVTRGHLALEQALDQLEQSAAKPAAGSTPRGSVLSSLLDAAVRDLRP
jgi:hypothetical protein